MEIVKLKFYWSLGEDICEKQKQYKWDANFMKRLSLDLRAEFPQSEGFSRTNLYDIKRCFAFYSSQIEFVHQAGGQLQEVDDANLLRCEGDIPSIGILLCKDKDSSVVEWSLRGHHYSFGCLWEVWLLKFEISSTFI